MKLHLQGMGVIGSLLALKLHQQGQKFTWSDIDAPINAWKASTGCIYPSGDPVDKWSYNAWKGEYFGKLPEFCSATYCFLSKNPPHGGKYPFTRVGPFGVASLSSFHLNAQRLVPRVRELFASSRRLGDGGTTIVTHGFNARMQRCLWGWMVKVKLHEPKLSLLPNTKRFAYYFKAPFYNYLAYAYPIPQESGWYYAGSSIIPQDVIKSLEIAPKFACWKKNVWAYGHVKVKQEGIAVEGWRPAPAFTESEQIVRKMNGQWVIRPQWSSGIRHAPGIVETLLGKVL